MPVILPVRPSLEVHLFRSILDGVEYRFRVRWNSLEQAFYFDVREITREPILLGVKIVLGVYLGRVSSHRLFRRGVLVARPQGENRAEARFDDLGTRVQLWYFTTEEVVVQVLSTLTGTVDEAAS